jgi:hypothetical protein
MDLTKRLIITVDIATSLPGRHALSAAAGDSRLVTAIRCSMKLAVGGFFPRVSYPSPVVRRSIKLVERSAATDPQPTATAHFLVAVPLQLLGASLGL